MNSKSEMCVKWIQTHACCTHIVAVHTEIHAWQTSHTHIHIRELYSSILPCVMCFVRVTMCVWVWLSQPRNNVRGIENTLRLAIFVPLSDRQAHSIFIVSGRMCVCDKMATSFDQTSLRLSFKRVQLTCVERFKIADVRRLSGKILWCDFVSGRNTIFISITCSVWDYSHF